jgi:AmmeMemoRadiSam system protein A
MVANGVSGVDAMDTGGCDDATGRLLPPWARACIRQVLGGAAGERPSGPVLDDPGCSFVTLRRGGALHGCIGSIEPRRPLVEDVARHAVAAAIFDPRATPLALEAVDALDVEVSVLSPLAPLPAADEPALLAALQPGVDGLVLRSGHRSATFLPQVWASLPAPEEFLAHLKRKAGLPADFWEPEIAFHRFTVCKWIELAPAIAAAAAR